MVLLFVIWLALIVLGVGLMLGFVFHALRAKFPLLDLHPFRNIGVAESRMGNPVHARDLLRIEANLFVNRAAQPMQHRAFHSVAKALRIDDQTAVMRASDASARRRMRSRSPRSTSPIKPGAPISKAGS